MFERGHKPSQINSIKSINYYRVSEVLPVNSSGVFSETCCSRYVILRLVQFQ